MAPPTLIGFSSLVWLFSSFLWVIYRFLLSQEFGPSCIAVAVPGVWCQPLVLDIGLGDLICHLVHSRLALAFELDDVLSLLLFDIYQLLNFAQDEPPGFCLLDGGRFFDISGDVLVFKASPSQPVIIWLLNEIFPSLQPIVDSHS